MLDPTAAFAALDLPAPLLQALESLGYETPSPIQAEAIPLLLAGRDLVGQAQTGTGKTAAFALPLLARIELARRSPQALVITPTRELAVQVAEAFQAYARNLPGFHVLPVYGGQPYHLQIKGLQRGAHVVVGTPGRLLDHLDRGTLDIGELHSLVLDEADEMLRMGFIDDVERLVAASPDNCRVAMFSATMPRAIRDIAGRYLKDPAEIKIASRTTTVERIRQRYLLLHNDQKLEALNRILEVEPFDGVIVFVRTKSATVEVAERLEARGFAAAPINGDMDQRQRERTINRLKEGEVDIVVATDVAARGLDVERISLVINYDIPLDVEPYVHRIGRTGRAGREGSAILFITPRERRLLSAIERATNQRIERASLPTNEELEARRGELFRERIVETFAEQPLDFYFGYLERLKGELNMSIETLAPALLYLAQRENSLQVTDSPPVLPEPRPERSGKEKRERRDGKGKDRKKGRKGEPPTRAGERISFETYRVEVGTSHGAKVSNIVGAIANEAEIDSRYIGRITLHEEYSTVQLPRGMPKELYHHLRGVFVAGRRLDIRRVEE